jgi:PAS domain S-box-containing protein
MIICLVTFIHMDGHGNHQHPSDSLLMKLASPSLNSLQKFQILNELTRINWKVSSAKSITYGKEGLELANSISNDSCRIEIMQNLGVAYYYATSFEVALSYFFQALALAAGRDDLASTALLYNSIANVYLATYMYDKALNYYQKSLEIRKKMNDKKGMSANYINISRLYGQTGRNKESWNYLEMAISLLGEIKDSARLSTAYNNLGQSYYNNKDYQHALEFNRKALMISHKLDQPWEISYILNSMGEVYLDQNRYDSALISFEMGLKQARKINSLDVVLYSYRNLTKYYSAVGNYKAFLDAFTKYNAVRDSIFTSQVNNSIAEMQVKYETESKEKENALQKLEINRQRNLRNSFIFISIIILIAVVVLFYRYRAKRKQSVLLEKMVGARTSELRKSEQLYRTLIDTMPDAVIHTNIHGVIQYISDHTAKLFLIQEIGEMLETTLEMWVAESDRTRFIKFSGNPDAATAEIDNQFMFLTKTGIGFPGEIKMTLQKNPDGMATGWIAVIRDITERKLFERRILKNTIETEERERTRFSEDLHDGLGPLLSTVKIHLELIRSRYDQREEQEKFIRLANELLDEAIRSTKEIANNLAPNVLNDFGLLEALSVYIDKINRLEAVRITFNSTDFKLRHHREIETAIYRIAFELINNTLKHANAGQIEIKISDLTDFIEFTYADNGIGMNWLEVNSRRSKGLGLPNIISRVKSLNGEYDIKTSPGDHFQIGIRIPFTTTKI